MTLFWIGFFAILTGMFVISFFLGQKIYGRQIALQNLKIAVFGISFGMLLVAGFSALPNGTANMGNVLLVFSALSVCFVLWMLFRNKSFKGEILYTLHPTIPNKIQFWLGVFLLVLQPILLVLQNWLYFQTSTMTDMFNAPWSRIGSFILMMALGALFLVFSQKPRAHQHGFAFSGMFIRWEKITEYKWENTAQNIFRIRYKNDIPFTPNYTYLPIHTSDIAKLLEILKEKRPDLELTP
jgi:hypothetical protein